jgi:hypothetical protein
MESHTEGACVRHAAPVPLEQLPGAAEQPLSVVAQLARLSSPDGGELLWVRADAVEVASRRSNNDDSIIGSRNAAVVAVQLLCCRPADVRQTTADLDYLAADYVAEGELGPVWLWLGLSSQLLPYPYARLQGPPFSDSLKQRLLAKLARPPVYDTEGRLVLGLVHWELFSVVAATQAGA